MSKVFLILSIFVFVTIIGCGSDSDNTTGPTGGYAILMQITGDKTMEFKTNTFVALPPGENPNYLVTFTMTEEKINHIFSMTFDAKWLSSKDIDLSRDDNKGTLQFTNDTDTYRIVSGNFLVETLNDKNLKGKLNFKAVKVGTTDVEIEVVNGLIDIRR